MLRAPATAMMVSLFRFRVMIRSRDNVTLRLVARVLLTRHPASSAPRQPASAPGRPGNGSWTLARVRAPGPRFWQPPHERGANDHPHCRMMPVNNARARCDMDHAEGEFSGNRVDIRRLTCEYAILGDSSCAVERMARLRCRS